MAAATDFADFNHSREPIALPIAASRDFVEAVHRIWVSKRGRPFNIRKMSRRYHIREELQSRLLGQRENQPNTANAISCRHVSESAQRLLDNKRTFDTGRTSRTFIHKNCVESCRH